MKIKRFIALALSVLMMAAVFAGCGGGGSDDDTNEQAEALKETLDFGGETITFVYPAGYDMVDTDGSDPFLVRRSERMAELGELYNCTIEQKEGKGTYWSLMANSIASGSPYGHVMITQENYILEWFKAGAIADLSSAMEATGIDFTDSRYSQTVRKATRFDGGQYAFSDAPLNPTGAMWYVNLTIFDRDQLGDVYEMIENKEWTWDKVEEIATKATKTASDGTVTQWGLSGYQHYQFLLSLAQSNGSGIANFDDDGNPTLTLNDSAALTAFQTMYDWAVTKRIANINDGSATINEYMNEFCTGNTAITVAGNKLLQIAEESGFEDEIGVVYCPIGPEMDDYVVSTACGQMYFIPKTYESMTTELLLLCDEIFAPYDDATQEDLIIEKYAQRIGDNEDSMNVYIDLATNSDRWAWDAVTLTKLDWSSPSVHEMCATVLSGSSTPGDAIESNKTQFLTNMQDMMDGHTLKANDP